jgi:hypothetical protein
MIFSIKILDKKKIMYIIAKKIKHHMNKFAAYKKHLGHHLIR